ncbi:excalibur calcium-binding domain-containing protein [Nocardia sp. NPDC004718]
MPPQAPPSPYYKNCPEVRNASKAPLRRGQPGYAPHLDRDNDGIACE